MAENVDTDDVSAAKAMVKSRLEEKIKEIEGYLDPYHPAPQQNVNRTEQSRPTQQVQTRDPRQPVLQQHVPREIVTNGHQHPQVVPPRSTQGGIEDLDSIDWEYLEEPDESLSCEICLSLMKDPRLLSCCGEHNACNRCIEKAGRLSKACPFCRSENFKLIPNNEVKDAIEKVKVWCPNKAEGCKWSGRISDARVHLSECQHTSVFCPRACGLRLKRHELDEHSRRCSNLPLSCRFVNVGCKAKFPQKNLLLHNKDNIHNHLLQIAHRNEAIRKAALSSSQTVDQVEKILADKLSKIQTMKQHLASSQQTVKSLEQKIDDAKKQLHTIREEHHTKGVHYTAELQAKGKEIMQLLTASRGIEAVIEKLPVPPVKGYTAIPVTFTIDNFSARKQNDEEWISPPFYTHVAGYKMCLAIYTNGNTESRGTHVSVYLHLMHGENDDYLPWPFPGAVITILFLNQRGVMKNVMLESFGHAALYITIEGHNSDFCKRVTDGTYGSGWGRLKAIATSQIGRYVVNDALNVKIHKIDFLPL